MAVWYVVLLRLRSKLNGIDFRKYLLSLVFPPIDLSLLNYLSLLKVLSEDV